MLHQLKKKHVQRSINENHGTKNLSSNSVSLTCFFFSFWNKFICEHEQKFPITFKSIKRSPTNTSWHSIYSFPIIEEVPQSIPDFSSHYFSPYSSKLITKTIEMIFSLYSKIKKKQIPNHRHCIKPKLKDRNQLTTRIIYNLWEFF